MQEEPLLEKTSVCGGRTPTPVPVLENSQDCDSDQHELCGKVLDARYRLDEVIGEGGMGLVFKGYDLVLNQIIAVKVLRYVDKQFLRRFKQEARTALSLSHPGIVKVINFGIDERMPFLIMEFAPGEPLDKLLHRGPMEWREVVKIALDLAEALAHSHKQGVFHRDLKPSNIMIFNGHARLLDFGIAKVSSTIESGELTQTGEVVGSPNYMSPEQCQGRPVDARSDVYSLGCVLYRLLTGKHAVEGDTVYETVYNHINKLAEPLSHVTKNRMPNELELLVLEMLEKDPDKRPPSMEELVRRLKEISHSKANPVVGFLHGFRLRARKFSRASRVILAYVLPPVVSVVLLAGIFLWRANTEQNASRSELPPAAVSLDAGETALRQQDYGRAEQFLRDAQMAFELKSDESDDYFRALDLLAKCYVHEGKLDLAAAVRGSAASYKQNRIYFGDANNNLATITDLQIKAQRDPRCREQLVKTLNDQAALFFHAGDYVKAEQTARDAIVESRLLPDIDGQSIRALSSLGRVLVCTGHLKEAHDVLTDAEQRLSNVPADKRNVTIAICWNIVALKYLDGNEVEKARQCYDRAIDWAHAAGVRKCPAIAEALCHLGELALREAQFEKAEMLFNQSLRMYEDICPPSAHGTAYPLIGLGTAAFDRSDWRTAENYFNRAKQIVWNTEDRYSSDRLSVSYYLGAIKYEQGDRKAAEQLLTDCLFLSQQQPRYIGIVAPDKGFMMEAYGMLDSLYKDDNQQRKRDQLKQFVENPQDKALLDGLLRKGTTTTDQF